MDATIESLPQTGHLQISVNVSADMNFTAYAARKRVTRYAADEISMFMRGGQPTLVVSDCLYWRVPILLSLPDRGPLGEVGALDVDVQTGQLRVSSSLVTEIRRRAEYLVARPAPAAR